MKNIGPDMLANLDSQLAAGNIDRPTYEARRIEVMELIRSGRAIDMSAGERTARNIAVALILVIGFGIGLSLIILVTNLASIVAGLLFMGAAVGASRLVLRPRMR